MEKSLAVGNRELIIVKQLPVIEDRLDEAYALVQERLDVMSSLVVTESNYKELKKTRAALNKEFTELEGVRKNFKEVVEAPYKEFVQGAYKRLHDKYRSSIAELDGNIKAVEESLKGQRQQELFEYYEQYRQSLGLDVALAGMERSGIKVGLSGSMTSYKEQARAFLDKINGDLAMIDTLDNSEEVLVEYRDSLNVSEAVRIVSERHEKIEEEKRRREAEEDARKLREEREAKITAVIEAQDEPEQSFAEPVSVVDVSPEVDETQSGGRQDQILSTRYLGYEIFGTLDQLRGLKGYLQEALLEYCEMEGLKYGAC